MSVRVCGCSDCERQVFSHRRGVAYNIVRKRPLFLVPSADGSVLCASWLCRICITWKDDTGDLEVQHPRILVQIFCGAGLVGAPPN